MAKKKKRGMAAVSKEVQQRIASAGGKAAHAKGTAHEFTTEQASEAGKKGGVAAHANGNAHEFTSAEARAAGKKGGAVRWSNYYKRKAEEKAAEPKAP